MSRLREKVAMLAYLLSRGHVSVVSRELRRWLHSDTEYLGLLRDLTQPFETRSAKIALALRPIEHSDIPKLLKLDEPGITGQGAYERLARLNLLKAGFGTCYVAATADNHPCYMQWAFGPTENDEIQAYFRGVFPLLAPGEVLLEKAFTHESYRGLGIMPFAMSQIAEQGAARGASRAITFVDRPRIPSLKGCKRAGFAPYLLRVDTWRLLRQKIEFTRLPAGTPYPPGVQDSTEERRPAS